MRCWGAALLCGALCLGCGSSGGTPHPEGGAPTDGAAPSDGGRVDAGADRTGDAGGCTQTAVAPNPDILILLDRSGSMADIFSQGQSKLAVVSQALNNLVASTQTKVNWGLKLYGDDDMCGVNAGAVVGVAPSNAGAIAAALAPVAASGETPTETAIGSAIAYLHGLSDSNPKYLLLASGGQMSCAPGLDPSADDSTGAESAVSTANSAGFPTFVLGVVDDVAEVAATGTLNHMAIVGGKRQQDTSTSFYLLSDIAALTTAVTAPTPASGCGG
jgi:von Willebrand factor type A domain